MNAQARLTKPSYRWHNRSYLVATRRNDFSQANDRSAHYRRQFHERPSETRGASRTA